MEAATCPVEDLYDLAALQTARFGAILADPPWTFETYSAKGTGRSVERHYPCMMDNEIAGLPVTGRTRVGGGHFPAEADHVGAMPRRCRAPGPGGGGALPPMSGARPCGCSNRDPAARAGWGLAVGAVAGGVAQLLTLKLGLEVLPPGLARGRPRRRHAVPASAVRGRSPGIREGILDG